MMARANSMNRLIEAFARLPGLGPRSARRIVFYLLRHQASLMTPLAQMMNDVAHSITSCQQCGNLDENNPCHICRDDKRDKHLLCVVEQLADLWALERTGAYRGLYFVLGGALSAYRGIDADQLRIPQLIKRIGEYQVREVILATNATMEGQMTADYIRSILKESDHKNVRLSHLARGLPLGGELDYLDDGTLTTAFEARTLFKDNMDNAT